MRSTSDIADTVAQESNEERGVELRFIELRLCIRTVYSMFYYFSKQTLCGYVRI